MAQQAGAAQVETVWPPAGGPEQPPPVELDSVSADNTANRRSSWHPPMVRRQENGVVIWQPSAIRDGHLMVIEVEPGGGCGRPRVEWSGQQFSTYPAGELWQALLPVRVGAAAGRRLFWVDCAGKRAGFSVEIVAGDTLETKLRVKPKFTRKPPKRVVSESAAIKDALAARSEGRRWSGAFQRPTVGPTTSRFGVRRTFNGKLESRHRGHDFDGRVGTPVVASNDGVVVLAAKRYFYTGNAVFIDHGDRLFTMYFHFSRLDVETGDRVVRGQVIGVIGQSGRVTGPHLHFGAKYAGSYFDPLDLLAFEPGVRLSHRPDATGR